MSEIEEIMVIIIHIHSIISGILLRITYLEQKVEEMINVE